MHRHAGYQQHAAATAATTHRYSGTSRAFSASANPNEDWTKISDLAERRRIQNRIAQRRYRKNLKMRLAELQAPQSSPRHDFSSLASFDSDFGARTPEMQTTYTPPPTKGRPMFSHQYTRQLSTSHPPFYYPSTYAHPNTAAYTILHTTDPTLTPEMTATTYTYPPPMSTTYPTSMKSEFYGAEDMSPFSMGYAAISAHAYPGSDAHVKHPPRKP